MSKQTILQVENLKVSFDVSSEGDMPWTKPKKLQAVNDISFTLNSGETLGIVGESGCGKSTLARAIVKMVPAEAGKVLWLGNDLLSLSNSETRQYRKQIQMIFQDPLASLNPRMNIGEIIAEPLRTHYPKTDESDVQARVSDVMNKVGLLDNLVNRYPHEFSGGQCQRIGIARALILKPKLIICDEPVSALDVSIQAQVVNLLMDLQKEMDLALIFIAHDLSVVKHISTKIMVLYLGNMVELANSNEIYQYPRHPYTQALISSVPSLVPRSARARSEETVLEVKNVNKTFGGGSNFFKFGKPSRVVDAVKDVTIELRRGETLGVVGESGSGKSTLARCIIRLMDSDSGQIILNEVNICDLNRAEMRPWRAKIQMVFQDPFASLNPRVKIGQIIRQGPIIQGATQEEAEARTLELLEIVGLDERAFNRYPHEFSGGQRQRIGIARALALNPEILVADEPVSALDVSIQTQILSLLDEIRTKMNLSMVFITHDLRVAAQVCDRLAVMRYGEIVETGATADIFDSPQHSYTRDLLAAVPGQNWER